MSVSIGGALTGKGVEGRGGRLNPSGGDSLVVIRDYRTGNNGH